MRVPTRIQRPTHTLPPWLRSHENPKPPATPHVKWTQPRNNPWNLLERRLEFLRASVRVVPARRIPYIFDVECTNLHAGQIFRSKRDPGHIGFVKDRVCPSIGVEGKACRSDIGRADSKTPVVWFAVVQCSDPDNHFRRSRKSSREIHLLCILQRQLFPVRIWRAPTPSPNLNVCVARQSAQPTHCSALELGITIGILASKRLNVRGSVVVGIEWRRANLVRISNRSWMLPAKIQTPEPDCYLAWRDTEIVAPDNFAAAGGVLVIGDNVRIEVGCEDLWGWWFWRSWCDCGSICSCCAWSWDLSLVASHAWRCWLDGCCTDGSSRALVLFYYYCCSRRCISSCYLCWWFSGFLVFSWNLGCYLCDLLSDRLPFLEMDRITLIFIAVVVITISTVSDGVDDLLLPFLIHDHQTRRWRCIYIYIHMPRAHFDCDWKAIAFAVDMIVSQILTGYGISHGSVFLTSCILQGRWRHWSLTTMSTK